MADQVYKTYPEFDSAGVIVGDEPLLIWQDGRLRRITPAALAEFVVKIGGELLATSATPVNLTTLDEDDEFTLVTQTGKGFVPGDQVLVASNVEGVFIRGLVSTYIDDEITIAAGVISGDGTYANWTIRAEVSTQQAAALALKAPLASPTFTGVPAAPTAAPGTNTSQIATTSFVMLAVAALLDSAPGALDTLNELAAALGDDPNFAATVATQIGVLTSSVAAKAPVASPTFTGNPAAPTAAEGDNDTSLATTAFVTRALSRGYRIRSRVIYTSSTTYTKPSDVTALLVRVQGGGGGGGGAKLDGTGGGCSAGGGSGGFAESFITSPGASYAVTVGGGGAGGSSAGGDGGSGGGSSFGSVAIAGGGGGGFGNDGNAGDFNYAASGGSRGSASAGDILRVGEGGGPALKISSTARVSGGGGNSLYGGGGRPRAGANSGSTVTPEGGGGRGAGGAGAVSSTTVGVAGGAGAGGLVEVWEFVGGPVV